MGKRSIMMVFYGLWSFDKELPSWNIECGWCLVVCLHLKLIKQGDSRLQAVHMYAIHWMIGDGSNTSLINCDRFNRRERPRSCLEMNRWRLFTSRPSRHLLPQWNAALQSRRKVSETKVKQITNRWRILSIIIPRISINCILLRLKYPCT